MAGIDRRRPRGRARARHPRRGSGRGHGRARAPVRGRLRRAGRVRCSRPGQARDPDARGHERRRRHQSRIRSRAARAHLRPREPPGSLRARRPERRVVWAAFPGHERRLRPGPACDRGRGGRPARDRSARRRLRRVAGAAVRDAGRDPLHARGRRRPGWDVHGPGGDRGEAHGHSRPRDLRGHEPGCRGLAGEDRPRGRARGGRARRRVAYGPPARAPSYTLRVNLRDLPSVDELVRDERLASEPHELAVAAARVALEHARAEIRAGGVPGSLVDATVAELERRRGPSLRRVVNATGVLVHTNLGRAPLADAAVARVVEVAGGYSNLEYDLARGERGSRQDHLAAELEQLTGAEAALVVNNNAAAVLLALAALAEGREVVVSRGELIEIGDGFRIPDVLARSGARLVEVGTTNRTRASDYERAVGSDTAVLLRVHQSNFRVVGFSEQPSLGELAGVAHAHGL